MAGRQKKKASILIHYAVWDDEGQRHNPGETIEVSVEAAKRLIAEGKAERNDPFPGED